MGKQGLFAQGAFLFLGEILFGQLEHHRRQQRHADEVGDRHHAVEGLGDIPQQAQIHRRAEDRHQCVDHHKGLDDLFAEQILTAAGTVQAPAEDGGKGEAAQRHRRKDGDPAAVGAGKAADGQLRTGRCPVGKGGAAAQDNQCGQGADHDGVDEHLEHTEQALLNGILYVSAGMGDGGGTKAGLVGENAAGNALLHRGKHGAHHAAGNSRGIKSALDNGSKYAGDIFNVDNDDAKAQHHIQ